MKTPALLAAIALTLAFSAACSSGDTGGAGGSTAGPGSTGEGPTSVSSSAVGPGSGGSGTGGSPAECPGPGVPGSGMKIAMGTVSATVLDLTAAPVANTIAQVCGINICLNGKTDATGHVSVDAAGQELTQPALKFGDGLVYARFGLALTQANVMAGELITAKLPSAGVALAAGSDAKSGGLTISVPAGGSIEHDIIVYDTPDKQMLRAAAVPIEKATAFVDASLNLEILYGVAPLETLFCPAAKVTIPNDAGWAAGTAVEFIAHGLDIGEEYAPYGGWAKVSDGAVSADGTTVSTADGGGLPVLTSFGVRKK